MALGRFNNIAVLVLHEDPAEIKQDVWSHKYIGPIEAAQLAIEGVGGGAGKSRLGCVPIRLHSRPL